MSDPSLLPHPQPGAAVAQQVAAPSLWDRLESLPAFEVCLIAACIAVVVPLWASRYIPAVDLPEHLFLVRVLSELGDPGSIFNGVYVFKPGLTYLIFYGSVFLLGKILGIELAMKFYLSLVLACFPLSVWALTRALGRSQWLALLAVPLAFTDNFYWGIISFHSTVPLCIFSMAALVKVLQQPEPLNRRPALALGASLLAVQLVHGAAMILPGLAFPVLLALTPSDKRRRFRAIIACAPAAIVFLAWITIGVSSGRRLGAPGEPWTMQPGGLLSLVNYRFRGAAVAWDAAINLLHGGFWSWADRPIVTFAAIAAAICAVAGVLQPAPAETSVLARARPLALFAIAALLYFELPADINGYVYALAPRYAPIAALLLIPVLPFPVGRLKYLAAVACAATAIHTPVVLTPLFAAFGREASAIEPIVASVASRSKIMHLIVNPGSHTASHTVYLHYTAYLAFRTGSIPSFSLAIDPSYPIGYAPGGRPPASPWEWRPFQVDFNAAGPYYDYFLWRGRGEPMPFVGPFSNQLELVTQSSSWMLYRRRPSP